MQVKRFPRLPNQINRSKPNQNTGARLILKDKRSPVEWV
jgi:hypothetical protein